MTKLASHFLLILRQLCILGRAVNCLLMALKFGLFHTSQILVFHILPVPIVLEELDRDTLSLIVDVGGTKMQIYQLILF